MGKIDLLSFSGDGGCSAKLPAKELQKALADLPNIQAPELLVDISTHDDAGVYKINDDQALIQTTDFFPPVCSDPYEFGQIAAANALSDVYAMGGKVISAMNILAFPADKPLEALKEIIRGGMDKVQESGGYLVGGHTITDEIPKYGLAVSGLVHPERIITNDQAEEGDVLILTKPIGAGIIMSGQKIGEAKAEDYQACLDNMKLLNKRGAEVMQKYELRCATDITGFGLIGHALKMAQASNICIELDSKSIPVLNGADDLAELGCLPGACFRNQEFVEEFCSFEETVSYETKMLMHDAQTSGGLLMCVPESKSHEILEELKNSVYPYSSIVGRVVSKSGKFIKVH